MMVIWTATTFKTVINFVCAAFMVWGGMMDARMVRDDNCSPNPSFLR
jgi:hypothetical protein